MGFLASLNSHDLPLHSRTGVSKNIVDSVHLLRSVCLHPVKSHSAPNSININLDDQDFFDIPIPSRNVTMSQAPMTLKSGVKSTVNANWDFAHDPLLNLHGGHPFKTDESQHPVWNLPNSRRIVPMNEWNAAQVDEPEFPRQDLAWSMKTPVNQSSHVYNYHDIDKEVAPHATSSYAMQDHQSRSIPELFQSDISHSNGAEMQTVSSSPDSFFSNVSEQSQHIPNQSLAGQSSSHQSCSSDLTASQHEPNQFAISNTSMTNGHRAAINSSSTALADFTDSSLNRNRLQHEIYAPRLNYTNANIGNNANDFQSTVIPQAQNSGAIHGQSPPDQMFRAYNVSSPLSAAGNVGYQGHSYGYGHGLDLSSSAPRHHEHTSVAGSFQLSMNNFAMSGGLPYPGFNQNRSAIGLEWPSNGISVPSLDNSTDARNNVDHAHSRVIQRGTVAHATLPSLAGQQTPVTLFDSTLPRNNMTLEQTRAWEDAELLKMKREGKTYKAIGEALNIGVAESTLRGRYRTLTLPRDQRIRKPQWTESDIELLLDIVDMFFDQLSNRNQGTMTEEQKLKKISWKAVADQMFAAGASYKFSNSTCKKKWVEQNVTNESPLL